MKKLIKKWCQKRRKIPTFVTSFYTTMFEQKLVGRKSEREELNQCLKSNRSELVIVYGRRRIGKTFLIEQHFKQKFDFWYVGKQGVSTKEQLRQFSKTLANASGEQIKTFSNWFDAFEGLQDYLETLSAKRKKVVFIDEMPWMDRTHSNFVTALEGFWNGWAMRRGDIMMIATGSATSWMRDKLTGNKGGLHARVTCQLHLAPFTLKETEDYLRKLGFDWDRYQIMQSYMLLGGVPFYYSILQPSLSLAQNIDHLCFKADGKLRQEFDELYNALFKFADRYIDVVRALSKHHSGLSFNELSKLLKFGGSQLTMVLKNLERCDFVERWTHFGNKKRETIFRLVDFYTLFYYKFIESDHSRDEKRWSKNLHSSGVLSWMGTSFEMICLRHHQQIKKALGLDAISTAVSTWNCRPNEKENLPGAQIDMIIERADRLIHLCEIKFSVNEYTLTKNYEKQLRQRNALFQHYTQTKQSIVNTFITTYGVANVGNKSIVHSQVIMNDLFK